MNDGRHKIVGGVALGAPKAIKHFLSAEKGWKNLCISRKIASKPFVLRGAEGDAPYGIRYGFWFHRNGKHTFKFQFIALFCTKKKDPDLYEVMDPLF